MRAAFIYVSSSYFSYYCCFLLPKVLLVRERFGLRRTISTSFPSCGASFFLQLSRAQLTKNSARNVRGICIFISHRCMPAGAFSDRSITETKKAEFSPFQLSVSILSCSSSRVPRGSSFLYPRTEYRAYFYSESIAS